jgi:DNA modification methylase
MAATAWRNRIVDHGEEAPDQLLANPKNWRIHPKAQQDALSGVLDEVGWVQEVIVNKTTGHVVDGHLRVSLAISRQEPTIPVKYVELTPEEEALVLVTLDPLAGMAATAKDALETLLADVQPGSDAVTALLEDVAKSAGLNGAKDGLTGPDAVPEAKPVSKRGDVWACGEHRVMCGDSTDAGDVKRLMAGEKAAMVFADPPYGIDYKPDYSNSKRPYKHERIQGDEAIDGRWLATWVSERLYLCTRWDVFSGWETELASDPRVIRNVIVWDKGQGAAGALESYAPRHEFIIFATQNGAAVHRSPRPDNVWAVPGFAQFTARRAEDTWGIHPTQKPVALVALAVEDSSARGDALADPFLGSGTTMIAAERLGRRCYGMEIEPQYVDVAVKRWSDFTGRKATLDT